MKTMTRKSIVLAALVFAIILSLTVYVIPDRKTTEALAVEGGSILSVEVKGICDGDFIEFSSIGYSSDVVESRSTTSTGTLSTMLLPGRLKRIDLEISRVIDPEDLSFYNWRKLVEDGKITSARKDVKITLYNAEKDILAQWMLLKAWPTKIEYKTESEMNLEKVTIAYEAYQRLK